MPLASVGPGLAVIDRYEQHLQWLFQGHQHISRQWLQTEADSDPELAVWLSLRLRVALPPERLQLLAPHLRQQLSGWQLYYQGQYQQAAEQFALAWPVAQEYPDSISPMDVALGLGKVYTRTGDWSLARNWILYSLALARAQQRLFAITEKVMVLWVSCSCVLAKPKRPKPAWVMPTNYYPLAAVNRPNNSIIWPVPCYAMGRCCALNRCS